MFQNDCQTSNKAMSFIDTLKKLIIIRALYLSRKYCRGEDEQQLQCPQWRECTQCGDQETSGRCAAQHRPVVPARSCNTALGQCTCDSEPHHTKIFDAAQKYLITTTTINRDYRNHVIKQCFSLCC